MAALLSGSQQDAHESDVSALCFSPDGTCLATGGSDRVVKVWTLKPDMRKYNISDTSVVVTPVLCDTSVVVTPVLW